MMERKSRGLLVLFLVGSSFLVCSLADDSILADVAVDPDPVVQRITRSLQETRNDASTAPDTASVTTAAANIGPPSLGGMRSGVQNFFGRLGEWFAEVGQLRPRLPSMPQRAQRGSPSSGSGSSGNGRDSSSNDGDRDSSRSGRDDSSSRRTDSVSGGRGRDSSRRDRGRDSSSRRVSRRDEAEVLTFQPPDVMESGRASRLEERSSRREYRRSGRD